jgi:predicted helicase
VIGNPPYSGESANKGDWIMGLMEAYKKEPGGQVKLNERNPKWINDDYVKFIRFAEQMIAKTGEGILGFITNHGYLDNPTFRGMRWHLLKTFDKIYVLDLHGNSKKKEVSPDGVADKNVFDIMQGVAIIIGVKRSKTAGQQNDLAEVWHGDLWGGRTAKNEALWQLETRDAGFVKIEIKANQFAFVPRDYDVEALYLNGFKISELFANRALGFQTHRDDFAIAFDDDSLRKRLDDFRSDAPDADVAAKHGLKDNRDWQIKTAREAAKNLDDPYATIKKCLYRPFDARPSILHPVAMDYPRPEFNSHIVDQENLTILTPRQVAFGEYYHIFVSDLVAESCAISTKTKEGNVNFPLFQIDNVDGSRRVNFDPKIYAEIKAKAGLQPSPPLGGEGRTAQPDGERGESADGGADANSSRIAHGSGPLSPSPSPPEGGEGSDAEIKAKAGLQPSPSTCDGEVAVGAIAATDGGASNGDGPSTTPSARSPSILSAVEGQVDGEDYPDELRVFDYIYGVLHAPDYRATYAQFLKIDFPRIPYPPSPEIFAHVAEKGGQLRRLHLMEDAAIGATPYPFSGAREDGDDNVVEKPAYVPLPQAGGEYGRVHINPDQYFENVPALAWEFHIGGYQPAQKWLKDRKGRALSFDDLVHYQKIIKILSETDRIMREIILPL